MAWNGQSFLPCAMQPIADKIDHDDDLNGLHQRQLAAKWSAPFQKDFERFRSFATS